MAISKLSIAKTPGLDRTPNVALSIAQGKTVNDSTMSVQEIGSSRQMEEG